MAEILPKQRKLLYNQSINQSINKIVRSKIFWNRYRLHVFIAWLFQLFCFTTIIKKFIWIQNKNRSDIYIVNLDPRDICHFSDRMFYLIEIIFCSVWKIFFNKSNWIDVLAVHHFPILETINWIYHIKEKLHIILIKMNPPQVSYVILNLWKWITENLTKYFISAVIYSMYQHFNS